jgi:hypothetical protein
MKKTNEDEAMIRYLLGEGTEEEQLRLEEQFFQNDESYQQLVALEDELRYDYAQGGLTKRQRASFEKRFLVNEEDRRKVALAKEVMARALKERAETMIPARQERTSFWQFFTSPLRLSFAASAALLVVFGGLLTLHTVQLNHQLDQLQAQRTTDQQNTRQQVASLEKQRADLEKQLNSKPIQAPTPTLFSFVLMPGLTRDADVTKPLLIPAGDAAVQLQLDVKKKGAYKNYLASVQTLDGEQVWSQNLQTAQLTIPAKVLRPGDYVIELKGIVTGGEQENAGEFYFTVVRK